MSNKIQLFRTNTPGNVPSLAQLLDGEMAVNLVDKNIFIRLGGSVDQINAASFLKQDSTHRLVSDAQISSWSAASGLSPATAAILGSVKVGENIMVDLDGTIHIPTASGAVAGVISAFDFTQFSNKQNALGFVPVNRTGDTLTGALILSGNPTVALEATPKQYVDSGLSTKVDTTGATMTGSFVLAQDPIAGLEAATKQYVDSGLSAISGRYAAPVADLLALSALVSTTLLDRQLRLVEGNGTIYRYDVQSAIVADGVGVIIPDDIVAPSPGRWIKVTTATQDHASLTGLQGGAVGDYLHLTTAEKNGYDSHITDATLHLTSAQDTWLGAISATAAEVNTLVGVTSGVQSQLDGKQASLGYTAVNLAGDTMLGALTLNGDPTAALHAVTKQWAESRIIDGGTF